MKRVSAALARRSAFALGLLVFTLAYLTLDYTYGPALRTVPALVGWIMVILLLLDLASQTQTALGRALRSQLSAAPPQVSYPLARQTAAILWVAGFAAALVLIGVLLAVPLFVFAFMRWRGRRPVWASLLGSGGVALFVWLLFVLLLRLELYPGLVFGGA
jgi:Tripartite tricarboxylate transporter TctB family